MAQVGKVLSQGLLTAAGGVIYTAPTGKSVVLSAVLLANVTVVNGHWGTLYLIPPTVGTTFAHTLYPPTPMNSATLVRLPCDGVVFAQGWRIEGAADADNSVSCLICGVEYDA
jgi:hypothetical protein